MPGPRLSKGALAGLLRFGAAWLGSAAIPAAWLELVRLVAGSPFTGGGLIARWAFVAGLLLASWFTWPQPAGERRALWPWPSMLAAGALVLAAAYDAASGSTAAAWLLVAALYVVLLCLERGLTSGGGVAWRWGARLSIFALGGAAPVLLAQFENRFSDEEFFVALQWLALSAFAALLWLGVTVLSRWRPAPAQRGLAIQRGWLGLALAGVTLAGLGLTVRAYQRSFYPHETPAFEGIPEANPFLCSTVAPDPQVYAADEVFARYLAQIAASPYAGPPEYGLLAAATGETQWLQAFRESILDEAMEGRFTEPAHSVKSAQHEAALRIYYLSAVLDRAPELFSAEELALLQTWTDGINHRAQTVELVDWMYGLAFTKWPGGPYENQEHGAGLLALLQAEGWEAPELAAANQDYLERNHRGWTARFRNTDDALIYQLEWITNAFFQALYTGEAPGDNLRRSFDWLLLQALPDGAPMGYNHPYQPSLAGIALFGAQLQEDPRLVWLAGRTLDYAVAHGKPLFAQPGTEQAPQLAGESPTVGSCLLYGDSGLPNQVGPLAPDKIVFRDGWGEDDAYLLLNLRFTGWHRYKATNAVSLVYKGAPLAADVLEGVVFDWLPEGRSVFRDKRIPRENLNGLLVPRRGLDAVLYFLTGFGGPWAQDPPAYAEVIAFEPGEALDSSHTRLADWQGWQHDRWVYFYHDGPVVVVDSADGPAGGRAALAWHLQGAGEVSDGRIALGSGEPAEVVLFGGSEPWTDLGSPGGIPGDEPQEMIYYPPMGGQLRAVTVFLMGEWAGALVEMEPERGTLEITRGDAQINLRLPDVR